ncbi:iron-containing alcohol dehydrogenase [bacterium]
MTFQFATANILFGVKTSHTIPDRIKESSHRIFLVAGKNTKRVQWLVDMLISEKRSVQTFSIPGEPTISIILEAVHQARQFKADVVVGIGGGSVLDTGKIVAALLANDGDLMDYLEVIGGGKAIQEKPVPYIAVPTTAGTGTEVTKNAVITSTEHQVKVSMRHAWMVPALAIVDPELTYSLPPDITASTGLDALTQLIEPLVTHQHNPLTDGICREGLIRIARSLTKVYMDGTNKEAREDMSISSLFGGLALANAKLGAVHGLAGPLGGMFNIPHGVICARLLPHVIKTNLQALRKRDANSPQIDRFQELGCLLLGHQKATANDALSWIQTVCNQLSVPRLSEYGISRNAFHELIQKSLKASSMKGNPIQLSEHELNEILERAVYE